MKPDRARIAWWCWMLVVFGPCLALLRANSDPRAAEPREFSIAPGDAATTLREFARQAGCEIVFAPEVAAGVATSAVAGRFTVAQALPQLLAGTPLAAFHDPRTRAVAVYRRRADNGGAAADAARRGAVFGQVRHAATGTFLEGAAVHILNTNRRTYTGPDGAFAFEDLPPSPILLEIGYTGADPLVVAADPAERPRLDLVLGARFVQMERVIVSELQEGNAHALTRQKNAINAKEAVATDAFGNLRDGNVAELLVLLPGVVGEWVGNDVRTVQIRGFNPNLALVALDGSKLANAESGGNERRFEWDVVSADHIESVEVIKAPTPDMEADAIGGTVNLRTKSAFNHSDKRRVVASAGVSYEPVRGTTFPNGSLAYSEVFGANRQLGVSFNWGYSRHNVPRDGTALAYPAATNIPNYIQQLSLFDQENVRERGGGGLRFDLRLGETSTVSLNLVHSYFMEQLAGRSMIRRVVLQTSAAAVQPGFTDDRVEWQALPATTATQLLQNFPKESSLEQIGLSARHQRRGWTFEAEANASAAETVYDSIKHQRGAMSPTLEGIGLVLDRSATGRSFPTIAQTSGPDLWDLANYRAAPFMHRWQGGKDRIFGAQANVERHLDASSPLTLKGGIRYRRQTRSTFVGDRRYTYLGPDGRADSGDETLTRFADTRSYGLVGGRYPAPRWLDLRALAGSLASHPRWFGEDVLYHEENRLANDRLARETVFAGYFMATARFGRTTVLAGVRHEATRTRGESAVREVTPAEAARRAQWVGPLTLDEQRRRLRAEYGRRSVKHSGYDQLFPSVHVRHEAGGGLVLRASYSTAVGRPSFENIVPDTAVDYDDRVVTTNNVGLRPQYGRAIDAAVQYYFEPVGVISLGGFHHRIERFIYDIRSPIGFGLENGFAGDYGGFELRTQENGGSATITGLEIGYLQPLWFLPGPASRLAVFGNYTRLQTRGTYGGSVAAPVTELVGFVPESANAGISYSGRRLEVRVKSTYKGEWLTALSPQPGGIRYTESRINWDLNLLWRLDARTSLFVDWLNLFDSFDPDYQYRDSQVRRFIPSGSRVNFGLRIRL